MNYPMCLCVNVGLSLSLAFLFFFFLFFFHLTLSEYNSHSTFSWIEAEWKEGKTFKQNKEHKET